MAYRKLIVLVFCCIFMVGCKSVSAQETIPEPTQNPTAPYRLFQTGNMWTFIELDTASGKMWQVHFAVNDDNARGVLELSMTDLAVGEEKIPGRFTLYPTANIYNFVLLDQIDGRTWQVQWSFDEKNRFVIPIS